MKRFTIGTPFTPRRTGVIVTRQEPLVFRLMLHVTLPLLILQEPSLVVARSVFVALVSVAVIRYVVPAVAAKVATSGFFTGLPRNPFFFGVIRTLLVMLGLVHLTFTGVAGAAVAGAAVAGAVVAGAVVAGAVGVTPLDATDALLGPAAFVAVTVNE